MLSDQVNLQIPIDLPPGAHPVAIRVNAVQPNSAVITGLPRVGSYCAQRLDLLPEETRGWRGPAGALS